MNLLIPYRICRGLFPFKRFEGVIYTVLAYWKLLILIEVELLLCG